MHLEFEYSEFKRLASIINEKGRSIVFEYNDGGRVRQISTPSGSAYRYVYDEVSRLRRVVYPTGGGGQNAFFREYMYENASFPELLTGIIDEEGARYATWAYDENGRGVLSVHGNELSGIDRISLNYNADGTTTVDGAYGEQRDYSFVVQHGAIKLEGLSAQIAGCGGFTSQKSYDSNGFLASTTDFNGSITEYERDARGLELQRVEGVGESDERRIQTDWHSGFHVPVERRTYDASADMVALTNWTYNARGQVLAETRTGPAAGAPRATTTTYCEQADFTAGACPLLGLVTSVDGPRTDVNDLTTFTYYPADHADCTASPTTCPWRKGDLRKVANALGQITETLRYDGAGRPLSVKDANGVVTDMKYHPRGWLTARKVRGPDDNTENDDRITRIDYWPTGLVQRVTQPDGAFTEYTYDAAHRLTTIRDNAGNTITYTLDNAGNRIAEDTRDSAGTLRQTLSRVYDQLGQLATQADASDNPTDYTYDANGNLKTITDALGRETLNDYDPLNRLVRTLQDVGGIEVETRYEYDALDHLIKVVDPKGLETDYTYNAFGDLLQLDSPDTGTTTYTYDSAGNRTGQVDARGQASTYTFDALNRLTGIAYTGAADLDTTYTYDVTQPGCAADETFSTGRLTAMSDASGSARYCYDRFGQLVRKLQVTNGQTFTLRYAYTKAGQLSSLTYPDGSVADYVRDAQGRVTEVGVTSPGGAREVLLSGAEYYPFGPAAGWSYGNGRTLSRVHDLDYRPQSVRDPATGGLDFGYSYDPVGNLSALHSADLAEPPRASFDYDALSRLTAFRDGAAGAAIESYGYDATGNRTSFANASGSHAYAYPTDSHRLTAVAGETRSYDAVGNATTIGTAKEFVYNAANRMNQVKQGGAVAMHYVYNGKGEQVRKHLGAHDITTVFDEAGRWLGDYDASGAPLQQAIWLDDLPVGLLIGSTGANRLHYVQPDHLGTPRAVIDPIRNVTVWNWDLASEAFGNSPPNEDPDGDGTGFVFAMRFPGQRYDAASGLNYNYFRDYEPATGRYAQSDPIGIDAGISTFSYVKLNPLGRRDPLGLLDDRPGEYCDPMRGMMCDPRFPEKDFGCGEKCRSYCRIRYGNMIEDAAGNYIGDDSCSVLGYDTSSRQDACEQMQAASYFILLQRLRRMMRECIGSCKPCSDCD
ncbi:RHS repeat-associated core domain-containing protein [Luteimonas sp. R10]|uniref:RHS repeat-associated core domain-containing protein n=1 Tax=Luteimonas sp. R10 TaxID=3108176 RepID=UPI003090CFBE|nr:RHS repeat-associated core domain-containing protein [Luteimonas sp. R10]